MVNPRLPLLSKKSIVNKVNVICLQKAKQIRWKNEYLVPVSHPKGSYNLVKIPQYAIELITGDVSSNLGASLTNTLLLYLQSMGLLNPSTDVKKYHNWQMQNRTKAKVKRNAHENHDEKVENIVCIRINGRNNKETLQRNCQSKWRENTEKKQRDQNATWLSQRRWDMKVNISLIRFYPIYWCNWCSTCRGSCCCFGRI